MTSLFDFKKIHRFVGRIVNQSNIRHLNWSKSFRDRVKKDIILALGEDCPPLLIQCFKQYDAAVEKEDQTELIIQRSEKTKQLKEADMVRDNTLLGIKSMVASLARIGTAEQKVAAQHFRSLYDRHGIGIAQRYLVETEHIHQFIQQCEDDIATDVETLGLTELMAQLKTENELVSTLIGERNVEASQIEARAMQSARSDVDLLYKQLVAVINAFAITQWQQGESPYDTAIDRINSEMDYYDKHVFAKGKKLKTLKVGEATFAYFSNETWREAIEEHATENAGWSVGTADEVFYGRLVLSKGDEAVDANSKVVTGIYMLVAQDDHSGFGVTPVNSE